jgi:hypothetical protein
MATTVTLLQLRTSVRQRSDMVNSQFVTDAEVNSYINASCAGLYDLLVQKYGDNYYVQTPYTFATDGINFQFALPADFYKLLGVDLALANTSDSFVTISKFEFRDRNRYAVPNFQSFYGVTNLRYRLNGNNLWFTPTPSGGQTIRVWYVPKITYLALDIDTLDGISGWEEYVIIDAAIKCMQKEESDCSVLFSQKELIIKRIESAAENRDAGQPPKVVDSMYNDSWWPTGSGSGDGSGAF